MKFQRLESTLRPRTLSKQSFSSVCKPDRSMKISHKNFNIDIFGANESIITTIVLRTWTKFGPIPAISHTFSRFRGPFIVAFRSIKHPAEETIGECHCFGCDPDGLGTVTNCGHVWRRLSVSMGLWVLSSLSLVWCVCMIDHHQYNRTHNIGIGLIYWTPGSFFCKESIQSCKQQKFLEAEQCSAKLPTGQPESAT